VSRLDACDLALSDVVDVSVDDRVHDLGVVLVRVVVDQVVVGVAVWFGCYGGAEVGSRGGDRGVSGGSVRGHVLRREHGDFLVIRL
jgi:hypothetical protein